MFLWATRQGDVLSKAWLLPHTSVWSLSGVRQTIECSTTADGSAEGQAENQGCLQKHLTTIKVCLNLGHSAAPISLPASGQMCVKYTCVHMFECSRFS